MYDVGGKLLSGIKNMHGNSLSCVRVKRSDSVCFRIGSAMRKGSIMFSWLFNVHIDPLIKEVKTGKGRRGLKFF